MRYLYHMSPLGSPVGKCGVRQKARAMPYEAVRRSPRKQGVTEGAEGRPGLTSRRYKDRRPPTAWVTLIHLCLTCYRTFLHEKMPVIFRAKTEDRAAVSVRNAFALAASAFLLSGSRVGLVPEMRPEE
jgi:hypothetical protein